MVPIVRMAEVGRLLALLGPALLLAGGVMALGRLHLPGDLVFRRGDLIVVLAIATCVVLSMLLTIVVNLLLRLCRVNHSAGTAATA